MSYASFLDTGVLAPQPGPQEAFFETQADIALYGGQAGGGKTMALMMEPLRHIQRTNFGCTIFRRTYPEIFAQGGLWETGEMIYVPLGGVPRQSDSEFYWPKTGARVKLAHMQHEKDKFSWMGSQIPLIEFDELVHFTETMFWYMLSRNRLSRPIGMRPYVRASCNPDSASWVAKLIEWWIDQTTGLAIPERSGVLRWFVRKNGRMIWGSSREEVAGYGLIPKSLTFINASIHDNVALMESDPNYLSNLQALPSFERMQLLDGNWKVRPSSGTRFKRHWFAARDVAPPMIRKVRYWDRAGTEVSEKNSDPDSTAGALLGQGTDGYTWLLDMRCEQLTPGGVMRLIRETAHQDGEDTELWLEQDPAQAGKFERDSYAETLSQFGPRFSKPTGSKWIRSGPLSAAAENGRIRMLRGRWNTAFLDQVESFSDPDAKRPGEPEGHDDMVDASSGGYNIIARKSNPGIH